MGDRTQKSMPSVAGGLSVSSSITGSSAATDVSMTEALCGLRHAAARLEVHAPLVAVFADRSDDRVAGHQVVATPVFERMTQCRHAHGREADDAVVADLGREAGPDREIGRRAAGEIVEEAGNGVQIERLQRFDVAPTDAAAVKNLVRRVAGLLGLQKMRAQFRRPEHVPELPLLSCVVVVLPRRATGFEQSARLDVNQDSE